MSVDNSGRPNFPQSPNTSDHASMQDIESAPSRAHIVSCADIPVDSRRLNNLGGSGKTESLRRAGRTVGPG
jgi:hypothetical protein